VNAARISALHVYPLKGARPLRVVSPTVAAEGLASDGIGDREWMVIDAMGGFVTQRSHPRLALVETGSADGALTLSAGGDRVELSLQQPQDKARDVTVWRSHVRGFDAGDAAASLLSAWLRSEVRLVRFDASKPRHCNPDYVGSSGAHTRFADGYPVLVIGAASLADLNDRLLARGHAPVPMDRFRPNIVLDGLDPYAEDYVDTLTVGAITLKLVKPCTRCEVTTTDQLSAVRGDEPLRTLSTYRHHTTLAGIVFGMNAIVVSGAGGTLTVGDSADVEFRF
jgi:uncharacterized protein YcbX